MRTISIVSSRFSPVKPGAIDGDQQRRREHAGEHQHGDDQREQRRDRAGDAIGFAALAARDQRRRRPE